MAATGGESSHSMSDELFKNFISEVWSKRRICGLKIVVVETSTNGS